jgi:hypothetical protein
LVAVYKKRQFNLEKLTTNSTLKQSKSIEISKDLVLILQLYHFCEKRVRRISCAFKKKRRAENLPSRYRAFIIGDRENEASPSFWRDNDREALWD